jgi:hypothetical protein
LNLSLSIDESQDSSFVFSRVVYFKVDYLIMFVNRFSYGAKITVAKVWARKISARNLKYERA